MTKVERLEKEFNDAWDAWEHATADYVHDKWQEELKRIENEK